LTSGRGRNYYCGEKRNSPHLTCFLEVSMKIEFMGGGSWVNA
jgi:hypothetical protein